MSKKEKYTSARWKQLVIKKGSHEAALQHMKELGRKAGSVKSPTKGFASMDKEKHKEVSKRGLDSRYGAQRRNKLDE